VKPPARRVVARPMARWADPTLWVRVALAASIVAFAPGLLEQFEAPKAEVVRVLGVGSLAALLVSARGPERIRWQPLDVAVGVWLTVEVLGTLFSVAPRLSLLGEVRQREGLLTSLGLAGLYFAARSGVADIGRTRTTVLVAIAAATLASLYALIQALGLDPLPWAGTAVYGGQGGFVRPCGTLGNSNLLGVVSAAAFVAALPLAVSHHRRRWLLAVATMLLGAITMLTLSRAAWLGAATGTLVAGALLGFARLDHREHTEPGPDGTRRWRNGLLIAVVLATTGILVVHGLAGDVLRARFGELLAPGGGSGRSRLEIWRMAIACWRARPWLGHGPDTLALVSPHYQTPEYWRFEWAAVPLHAHSIYLHTLATRGLLGFAAGTAWAVTLLLTVRHVWRTSAEARVLLAALAGALVAIGVAGAFGALGMAGAAFIVVASATVASLAQRGTQLGQPSSSTTPDRRALLLGGVATALALFWSAGDLVASRAAFIAQRGDRFLPGPDRMTARVAAAERAVRIRPMEDAFQWLRADVQLTSLTFSSVPEVALNEAEVSARRAVALAPLRALNHRGLGHVLMTRALRHDVSALSAGEAAYARCLELAPYDALAMLQLAQMELALGRPQAALPPAQRTALLYPRIGLGHGLLAEACLGVGDQGMARRALEQAVTGDWQGLEAGRRQARRMLDTLRTSDPPNR